MSTEISTARLRLNLTGRRFCRFTVIKPVRVIARNNTLRWLCRCDCGNERILLAGDLNSGHAKSCGCYAREMAAKLQFRHGHWSNKKASPEWTAWNQMRQRCSNPKNSSFKRYGARGIVVCERWQKFENFLADMGPKPVGPKRFFSVERKNNNGNYEPSNCKWATQTEQSNNRRSNRIVSWNGVTKTVTQWASELGIKVQTLGYRIRDAWPVEEAFTRPVRKYERNF